MIWSFLLIIYFYQYFDPSLQEAGALLKDSRFAALFENPDFEVDTESTEFRLLNPVVTKLDKGKKRKARDLEEEDKDKVS